MLSMSIAQGKSAVAPQPSIDLFQRLPLSTERERLGGRPGGVTNLRRTEGAKLFKGRREPPRVIRRDRCAATVVDDFGAAGDQARHDGQPAGERLEVHVAEWLVTCRQNQRVGGAIPALDVG